METVLSVSAQNFNRLSIVISNQRNWIAVAIGVAAMCLLVLAGKTITTGESLSWVAVAYAYVTLYGIWVVHTVFGATGPLAAVHAKNVVTTLFIAGFIFGLLVEVVIRFF